MPRMALRRTCSCSTIRRISSVRAGSVSTGGFTANPFNGTGGNPAGVDELGNPWTDWNPGGAIRPKIRLHPAQQRTSGLTGGTVMRRFSLLSILLLLCTVMPICAASAQSFRPVPGKLASIALGGTQTGAVAVWGLDSAQNVYTFDGLLFDHIPGSLSQISVDGSLVCGIDPSSNILCTIGQGFNFVQLPGKLAQISVHGTAVWGIDASQNVFQFSFNSNSFNQIPGKLIQIAVDAVSTSASSLAVWGISADQNIFSYDGTQFVQIPGQLTQISVGGAGTEVWGINASQQIFRYNFVSKTFIQVPGSLKMISVGGPVGNVGVWGVNAANSVFEFVEGTGFVQIPGLLTQIAVFGDSVWGINSNQDIFRFGF
jgi:Tectonin domain